MSEEEVITGETVKENTQESTIYHFINTEKGVDFESKIIYNKEDRFTLFPFYIDRNTNLAKPKYKKIKSITFEGFKGAIPSGYLTKAERGYGFTKYLRSLKNFIEKHFDVENILISKNKKTHFEDNLLIINYNDHETIRKGLSSLIRSSNEENDNFLNNYFSQHFSTIFQRRRARYQKGIINRILKQYINIESNLSSDDKNILFDLFNKLSISRKDILEKQELIKTKEIIEKKFIEDILRQFEKYLSLKRISEEKWQDFFKENSWIFSQIFSYPTVIFEDKAYVGGKSIQDREGRIVDFLYMNKLTKNSVIIEIKKHTSKILNKKSYRGSDVFTIDKDLSGAISQIIDQKDTYIKKFDSIRGDQDITAFNPKCIIIIGKISDLSEKQYKSFELLRSSLKDVEIVTYDELYERIKSILSIFSYENEI